MVEEVVGFQYLEFAVRLSATDATGLDLGEAGLGQRQSGGAFVVGSRCSLADVFRGDLQGQVAEWVFSSHLFSLCFLMFMAPTSGGACLRCGVPGCVAGCSFQAVPAVFVPGCWAMGDASEGGGRCLYSSSQNRLPCTFDGSGGHSSSGGSSRIRRRASGISMKSSTTRSRKSFRRSPAAGCITGKM